jgi:hypothetical protein
MEPQRKKRRGRGKRVQDSSFMDTVRAAFVRWVALEKWREVEDLMTTLGYDLAQAVKEAGKFPGRGRYQQLWVTRWQAEVRPEVTGTDSGSVFGSIERAVGAALQDEEAARKAGGDGSLEEDLEYKAFVDTALERLLGEGGGTLGTG